MNIRCKFDGGKLYNRCNHGSWHSRYYGGALLKNVGVAWSPIIWHKVTGVKPGQAYTEYYRTRAHQLLTTLKTKQKPEIRIHAQKRKMASPSQSCSKKARKEYGEHVLDVIHVQDIPKVELEQQCQKYMNIHSNLRG